MASEPRAETRPVNSRLGATVFKLAHLSDLHLAQEQSVAGLHQVSGFREIVGIAYKVFKSREAAAIMTSYDARCFRALMDALLGRNRFTAGGYDGYLITGDIATTGSCADMLAAAHLLRQDDPLTGGESLDPMKLAVEKVVLLPGNHDRYDGRFLFPTSKAFEESFGSNWCLNEPSQGSDRIDANHKILVAKNGAKLAVVCGDFSFIKQSLRWIRMLGKGRAREETIRQMVELTLGFKQKSIAVVWAVHFPPIKIGVSRTLRLEQYEKVVEAANKCGIKVIFCGHTHVANYSLANFADKFPAIQVVCAASACEYVSVKSGSDRSYFDVELEILGSTAQMRRPPTEMIYSRWLRSQGSQGRAASFCPAP